jgi:hypothetical protein
MSGIAWIKFYTNQLDGNKDLSSIIDKFKHEGFGRYWHLLLLLGKRFKENEERIELSSRMLRDHLRFKSEKKLDEFLFANELQPIIKPIKNKDQYSFDTSILRELLSRDFRLARSVRGQSAHKKKNKNKEIEKEKEYTEAKASSSSSKKSPRGCVDKLSGNAIIEKTLSTVTAASQKAWLDCYEDAEFLKQEILKAYAWIESNPRRRPKNIQRFLNNWFSRAWESRRKTFPTKQAVNSSYGKTTAQQRQENLLNMENPYEN